MKYDHPEADVLLRLLAGEVEEAEATGVGLHLLRACPECLEAVKEALGVWSLKQIEALAGPGWALDLAAERAGARRLLAPLAGLPWEERRARVEGDEDLHTWGVADSLLAECDGAWPEEPGQALGLAQLAAEILGTLDQEEAHVADLTARAWAYVANGLRVLSDLRGAEQAFGTAEERLAEGSGDERVRAEVLDLKASLRRDQRRIPEAERLSSEAVRLYLEVGDSHLAGTALLTHAGVLRHAGDVPRALAALDRALSLIDARRGPRLVFGARWTKAQVLFESGRREEAKAMAAQVAAEAERTGRALDRVRWRWYEGRMAAEEGRKEEAEAVFREVRQCFLDRDIGYDAALASLDLAVLYQGQGRTAEVRELAAEMLPVFESRDVHREAMAALLLFRRAAEVDLVTAHLLDQVRGYLERARDRPELRFEAPAGFEAV